MKILFSPIVLFLLLFCATTVAQIGGNEAALKARQQQLDFQHAISNFARADVDLVIAPYLHIVSQLKTQPQQNWCRADVLVQVDKALALNPSSLVGWSILYGCASKNNHLEAKQSHTDTINGLIGLLLGQNTGDTLDDAIHIRELLEAPLILQAMGYNVLDMALVLKNGGLFYHYHLIDPISSKVSSKYFTNLTFMKHQLSQPGISNKAAIERIVQAYQQQMPDPVIIREAKNLLTQQQYRTAETLLNTLTNYSMIKNSLLAQIYLHTKQNQSFITLSKTLALDAKAGFIQAAILLARFKLLQPDKNALKQVQQLLSRVDHFTTIGEGAYRLGMALHHYQQNLGQSVSWLNRAVEQQHAKAAFQLGRFYQQGMGVKKDNDRGLKLIRKAAKSGDLEAIEYLNH